MSAAIEAEYRRRVELTNATFEAGDLVEMTGRGCVSVALLLSSPDGSRPIEALFFEEGDEADAAFVFENRVAADFLGRDGRLLWRSGAKIVR